MIELLLFYPTQSAMLRNAGIWPAQLAECLGPVLQYSLCQTIQGHEISEMSERLQGDLVLTTTSRMQDGEITRRISPEGFHTEPRIKSPDSETIVLGEE